MKSRRDFLAALGLSAGALGLPGTARAWFGRRRRVYCAPAYCPQCAPENVSSEDRSVRNVASAEHSAGCELACPTYLYMVSNNIYYYYCQCCTIPDEHPIVPTATPVNAPLPVLCPDGNNCFEVAPHPPDLPAATGPAACPFVYYARYRDARGPVSTPYIDGIDAKDAQVLHNELVSGGPNAGLNVNSLAYVRYTDSKGVTRTVALYDLSRDNAPCPLHVGQEITGAPVAGLKPQVITGVTEVSGYPHYHRVNRAGRGPVYHVAVKK